MKQATVLISMGSWNHEIVNIVEALGGKAVCIRTLTSARAEYPHATHILLAGGADISPRCYRKKTTWAWEPDEERDELEWQLVYNALQHDKPLFGICRGHQMIAVQQGAKLLQDIFMDTGIQHPVSKNHMVFDPESAEGIGAEPLVVNSYHHQAVAAAPKGWHVTHVTAEGLIEGIGSDEHRVISVQWHPEVMQGGVRLFKKFLRMK